MENTKTCSKCGVCYAEPKNNFHTDRSTKDGLRSKCKKCIKDYYVTHVEERKQYSREYSKEYYASNAEKIKQYHREYYAVHKDYSKEYYATHADELRQYGREYSREYHAAYPEVVREYSRKRKTLKQSLPYDFTVDDEKFALEYWQNRCAVCGKQLGINSFGNTVWAFDHWIPLSDPRPDNPGTVSNNMLPLCHGLDGCNSSKHKSDPADWLYRTYPLEQADLILVRINTYFQSILDNDEFNS